MWIFRPPHCLIDLLLVTNVHAREFGGNEHIHILNCLQPWQMIYFASIVWLLLSTVFVIFVNLPWTVEYFKVNGMTMRKKFSTPPHLQHTLSQEPLLVTITQLQCLSNKDWVRTGMWSFTLPETNSSPLKIGLPNRKIVFQPSISRGKQLVSGRVTCTKDSQLQLVLIKHLHQTTTPVELSNVGSPPRRFRWRHH